MINGAKRIWARFRRTQVARAWKRYGVQRGNRLAGATTFFGFLSMFPLILIAAAITGALLDEEAVQNLQEAIEKNLPGIGDKVDLDALIANAGTIGLISGIALLFTGLGWIDSMRASIRLMHELDDRPGNMVSRKLADFGALVGLGLLALVGTGVTTVLGTLSERVVTWMGIEETWFAGWGLDVVRYALGALLGGLLFLYLQTVLPRIVLPRKVALIAAFFGGVVFVLAQELGGLYVNQVIGNNAAYGALALPLALLVWIYLLTRVIMLVAAWAKEATLDHRERIGQVAEYAQSGAIGQARADAAADQAHSVPAYRTVQIPQRKADTVAVAAGAVLGATATALTVTLGRAARTLLRGRR
jgi:membrane protein